MTLEQLAIKIDNISDDIMDIKTDIKKLKTVLYEEEDKKSILTRLSLVETWGVLQQKDITELKENDKSNRGLLWSVAYNIIFTLSGLVYIMVKEWGTIGKIFE